MCFDLTLRDSLENCENKWKGELDYFMKGVPFILVGCKLDLREEKAATSNNDPDLVPTAEGEEFAKKLGAYLYIETSAKRGDGVNELFEQAARVTIKSPTSGGCCTIM